jgi:DNA repair protein SbcC/Rad50
MIPLKLQIKNFVSYGSATQTIDFAPYQLICLSGKNGHGKSALLDALTWAIWGQARKISGVLKADDGLVRLGQTQMMVSLDFSCNGTLYRVRREYTSNSTKSFTNLDFGIVDPTSGGFRALTDKTLRITQAKIETMIGLDYESFINSAFLRQGQSNEFSKKSPKDRKEILATILGLDHFERMRKLASERVKEASVEREHLIKIHEQLKNELAQKEPTYQRLEELQSLLQTVQGQEADVKVVLHELKEQYQQILELKTKAERIIFQKEQLSLSITEQTSNLISEIQKYRQLLREQKTLTYKHLEEEHSTLAQILVSLQEQARKKFFLKEQLYTKKEAAQAYLQQATQAHQHQVEQYKLLTGQYTFTVQTLEQQKKESELQTRRYTEEYSTITYQLELLAHTTSNHSQTLIHQEKKFERRKAYYHAFIAKGNALQTELKNVTHKKHISQAGEQPICPLCQQDLPLEHKKSLQKKLKQQESLLTHQLERLARVTKALKAVLVEDNSHIESLRKAIEKEKLDEVKKNEQEKQRTKLTEQLKELENEQKKLSTAVDEHRTKLQDTETTRARLQHSFQEKLRSDTIYQTLIQETEALEKELGTILYDPKEEQRIAQRLQEITQLQQAQALILKEIALQEQRKRSINEACKHIKQLKSFLCTLEQESTVYKIYKEKEQELAVKEQEFLAKLQLITHQKELIIHQKGALEQLHTTLKEREKTYQEQEKALKNLSEAVEEYTAIAAALGKDGIQALLIEDAIPEIEHEANILLARLTDNQAHLIIESLRDLKNGTAKETLDIKISDAIGIRPYELFSGGEAFRIDFALRIAISKLLARRSGTALQTLIIDEGFGSQDEEGLSHIMEAIHKIQDDFAKVIVVSHLASLKDQFPIHFLVHKTAQGSVVKVIEHG